MPITRQARWEKLMAKLAVGVIVNPDIYKDTIFKEMLENLFVQLAGKLYSKLKEGADELPEECRLKIRIDISPELEEIDDIR